jgi:acyl-CoA thioesterase-1
MRRALGLLCSLAILSLALVAPAAFGGTLVVFGDSLSAAYGIAERRGWVALLEERLKRERLEFSVVNASISGETTSGGRSRLGRLLAQHKPAVLILELGANDGLRGLAVGEMKNNLAAMIALAQKSGARVLLVGVRMPPNYGEDYTHAFDLAFSDLARAHRTAFTPELTAGIGERLDYFQPDRIHPNEAAQPLLLENVWKTLRPLLKAGAGEKTGVAPRR